MMSQNQADTKSLPILRRILICDLPQRWLDAVFGQQDHQLVVALFGLDP